MRDAAVVVEGGTVAWVGPAARRPRGRRGGSTSAAARCPRLRRHPHATWCSPATAPRSSPPGWRGERYAAGGIRTTVAATRAATDEQLRAATSPGWSPRCARQGTTTVEIKSGYGLTVARRGARAAPGRAQFTDGDDLPRRPRGARRARRPDGVRRAGHRPDARGLRAVRPLDRRLLRGEPTPSTATRPARCSRPGARPGCGLRLHANQLGPGPGRRAGRRAGRWPRVDHCTYLTDADVDALRRRRHRRDAAAGRRVLHPARPTPTPAGCSTPGCRVALATRLQPGLVLHRLDAASASRWPCARWG